MKGHLQNREQVVTVWKLSKVKALSQNTVWKLHVVLLIKITFGFFLSSTHRAFSAVLNFCSAWRLNSDLQARTGHIPPTQRERSPAMLKSVITGQLLVGHAILRVKTTRGTWMIRLNTCFKSGTGSSFSSFDSSSHSNTCRAASYCCPYSTGNTSCKGSFHFYLLED